jgi:hypothetical protein
MKIAYLIVFIAIIASFLVHRNFQFFSDLFKKGFELLKKNEFMEGSFYTGVLGLISASLYYVAIFLKDAFVGRFLTSMTVNSNEEPFEWIIKYLGENPDFFYTAQKLTITERVSKKNNRFLSQEDQAENTTTQLVPGSGLHIFQHNNQTFWLDRVSNTELSVSGFKSKINQRLQQTTFFVGVFGFVNFFNKFRSIQRFT